ncbi:MAG: hypothetical protein R6U89_00750 [Dehalococcoidia bacterium]
MAKWLTALVTLVVLSTIAFACNDDESGTVEKTDNNITQVVETADTIDHALAVYLEMEDVPGVDYTKAPLKVKGVVSQPQATVTVNGSPTDVAEDGSFSSDVPLAEGTNFIEAVATYGESEDRWLIMVDISPEGNLVYVPGLGSGWQRYASRLIYDHNVDIKAGETESIDITLENGKPHSGPGPAECTYTISLVSSEYSEKTVPMPMGLDISVEPSRFTAYPNTTYQSTLTISTTPGLVGCKYYLLLEGSLEGGFTEQGWITVDVRRTDAYTLPSSFENSEQNILNTEDQSRLLQIALDTDLGKDFIEKYGVYDERLGWITIVWDGSEPSVWRWINKERIDIELNESPDATGQQLYFGVYLRFGDPEAIHLAVAIEPDTYLVKDVRIFSPRNGPAFLTEEFSSIHGMN